MNGSSNILWRKEITAWVLLLGLLVAAGPALAGPGKYQAHDEFLAEQFDDSPPQSRVVWLTRELRDVAAEILGHAPASLRLRYWQGDHKSVWIIDEIGKERPITIGVGIHGDRIETVRVLEFRESYGWEVRYPFFTRQFTGARLNAENELDTRIDSISGATLSVNAVRRAAALALYLHEKTRTHVPEQQQAYAKP